MAKPAAERLLDQIQVALAERVERWSAAIDVIVGPALERASERRTETEQVAAAFERCLAGDIQGDELLEIVSGARPDPFWTAVEAFSAGVSSDEWRALSAHLVAAPEVARERGRLRHLSSRRRALAARRLGLLEAPELREPLRKAMMRGPAIVTLQAALAVARLRDLPALGWLLKRPRATAGRTRRPLTEMLETFGPDGAHELRVAVANGRGATPIHVAAMDALGTLGDPESVEPLERLLREGPLDARVVAARALGRIGSDASGPALVAALDDTAWEVRAQAARSLGAIAHAGNVPMLASRVGDVAWWVRRHAAYALGRHGDAGRRALARIAEDGQDLFAVEMAREVLQQIEWAEDIPGGFERVA